MWKSEKLLTVIGESSPRDCITEARMVELTGYAARAVENYCLKLSKHGLLMKTARGCHKLTPAGVAAFEQGAKLRSGPQGPHTGKKVVPGTLRERVWRAMRLRRKASIPDLVMLVAEGGERDIESNIGKYLSALARAGYLQRLPLRERGTALTSNGHIRWSLIQDTGPLAPVWRVKADTIYDPNTETETPLRRPSCG